MGAPVDYWTRVLVPPGLDQVLAQECLKQVPLFELVASGGQALVAFADTGCMIN